MRAAVAYSTPGSQLIAFHVRTTDVANAMNCSALSRSLSPRNAERTARKKTQGFALAIPPDSIPRDSGTFENRRFAPFALGTTV
jgi:hypothetical protein